MKRQRKLITFVACVVLTLGGCGSESVTAVDPSIVVVSPDEESVYPDETLQLAAEVRDADGNTLPGRDIEWSSSDPDVATVDEDGLVAARAAGDAEIRASAAGATGAATVTVRDRPTIDVTPASVTFTTVEGRSPPSPQTVSITGEGGGQLAELSAEISYEEGEPDDWLVAELDGDAPPAELTLTVADGIPPPGTYEAAVHLSASQAGNSPTVDVTLRVDPAASPATSTIEAEPETIVADGSSTSTITVTARDANGNPRPGGGDAVELKTTAGGLSSVRDNDDGTYTATLTSSTTAGAVTIAGTLNEEPIEDEAVVVFSPADASPSRSTVAAEPNRIDGNGRATSTITVTIRDENGNVTSGGDTVEVHVEDDDGTLSPATDNEDGTYTATLTAPTALATRTATITATVNGEDIEDTAQVTYLGILSPGP